SALLLGVGSLHWTILGTTAVVIGYLLMLRFAVPLLLMFGIGLPAVVFAAICARTLRDLEPAPDQAADSTLRTQAHPAERTDALSRRSTSAPDGAHPLRKGIPACSTAELCSLASPPLQQARSRSPHAVAAAATPAARAEVAER